MRNIFLLEDDFYLRRDLKLLLTEAGYETAAAGSLAEASALLFRDPAFDLYLLDLWLPDGDGMTLLTQIRRRSDAPVLFLTVCDDEPSVIRALEQGADDYITKPFRKAELLSRIRANLRRQEVNRETKVLSCGDLLLDLEKHAALWKGDSLSIRPQEYRLLLLFMENPGILLTRERLLSAIDREAAEDAVDDNTLSVQISRLRKALPKGMIETERGFGYRFRGEVRRLHKKMEEPEARD